MDQWYKQDAANQAKHEACVTKARLVYENTNPPSTLTRLLIVSGIDLCGWLFVWGCVAVVRWVHRGFTTP